MKYRIKILSLALLILAAASLSACGNSYVMLYYENLNLMQDALSFTMKTVPDAEPEVYGAQDKKLGELQYHIIDDTGEMMGTLVFRMADAEYVEDYATVEKPGAAGIEAGGSASGTDRIGSCSITYYVGESTVFAIWENDGFAYSMALTYKDEYSAIEPGWDSIYSYVVAVIASK